MKTSLPIRSLHRVMPSRLKEVDAVSVEVRTFMSVHGLAKKSFGLELLLRECLNNAILHGNRRQAAKKVSLDLRLGRRWLRLRIADEGPGFNWRRFRHNKAKLTATHGRGFSIVEAYSDKSSYNRCGNQITLWLKR